MKKLNGNPRMVKTMNDDVRIFCYCTECGCAITDEYEEYYCNDDGEVFCSVECVLEHYCITQLER